MNIKYVLDRAKEAVINTHFVSRYEHARLDERLLLLESKHGDDLAGNIFALLKCLNRDYRGKYKIYLTCAKKNKQRFKSLLSEYGIEGVKLTDPRTAGYFGLLAKAKYLITDTSFHMRYIKKQGQIILNTWHGTPLKHMGRDVEDSVYSMGNIQRNLLFSDYLLYPNEYMKEKMVSAYMLDGVYKGNILNEGYPRNCVFFDKDKAQEIREQLGFKDKELFVYMPTWRGNLQQIKTEDQLKMLKGYLEELDRKLTDKQVLIAKLHPFVSADLDYSGFKHIIPQPAGYDSYEVLNSADCLITDYSSVFYDFANTGKKIILFAYDEEAYTEERGMYVSLDELPFPKVRTVEELYAELSRPKEYDDSEFIRRYCTYERPDATERILAHVLEGKKICNEEKIYDHSKENVLIFVGSLAKNGITTAASNLLQNLDTDKKRYFATFQQPMLAKEPYRVRKIPRGVNVLPMPTKPNYTIGEAFAMVGFYKLNLRFARKAVERMCRRDVKRFFSGIDFDAAIQYEGYGKNMIHLFRAMDCKKAIFVHNDMQQELKSKNNQHRLSLQIAYNDYDRVACVTKDLIESTAAISGRRDNIRVVNNCHAFQEVLDKAEMELSFDETTTADISIEELKAILDGGDIKIINIGRFSAEKGHDLLIRAFKRFNAERPDSRLIIIGGYGGLYDKTCALAHGSPAAKKITVIMAMSNPMPLLKRCDLFVLSSLYEGLGLTILEADTLGVPVVSTRICGPSGFMEDHGGFMVEPTSDGIYEGMKAFAEGRVSVMNVDYKKYNENSVEQFERLFL